MQETQRQTGDTFVGQVPPTAGAGGKPWDAATIRHALSDPQLTGEIATHVQQYCATNPLWGDAPKDSPMLYRIVTEGVLTALLEIGQRADSFDPATEAVTTGDGRAGF